ncbi:MAG: branched-chain amino acid ABC transporter permease, partial [Oscillochloris sp.]|nr:branched-chain amino acid ABC transporter permease [Oscillochloris sp.]
MAAEAKAPTRQVSSQRTPAELLRVIFLPFGQLLAFVVGSAVVLSLIVVVLAFLLSRSDPTIFEKTLAMLPQVIIDGIVRGFLFSTIALGYTMVYGVLEFINFAHGEIFMVGGFVGTGVAYLLKQWGVLASLPTLVFVIIAVVMGMTVSGLLAMGTERLAYRPLRNAPRLVPLISAIGMSLVLQDVVRLVATNTPLGFNARFETPDFGKPYQLASIPMGERSIPVSIGPKAVVFIVAALLMLLALNYLVNATRLGKAIRAVAQDRATASLMGINVNQIISLTFL